MFRPQKLQCPTQSSASDLGLSPLSDIAAASYRPTRHAPVTHPSAGPIKAGVGGWGSGSLEDSIPFLCGGLSAGRQTATCPSCAIFMSYGFPVGTQSSLQGLWVGSHEQGTEQWPGDPVAISLQEFDTMELKA